jgi:Tfp pilus assembly protein PilF
MKSKSICVLCLAILAAPAVVWAQSRPVIAGSVRIRDGNSGQPVLVQLYSQFGGLVSRVTASSSGRFEFFNVPQGQYDLVIDMTGYKPVRMRIEYSIAPLEGLLIDLVPDTKEGEATPGPPVPVRVLQAPPKAREEYDRAIESVNKKRPAEATAHFRKAIELYPEFDEAYLQLGMVHLQQNEAAQAQAAFENVTRIHPQGERGFMLLGRACRMQKKLEEAAQALERSIQLKEDSWFARMELGETLIGLGRIEDAHPHVLRAHELNPAEPLIHQLYYNTLIRRNQHREALAELEEFLKLFPEHGLAARARQQREALQKFLEGQAKP